MMQMGVPGGVVGGMPAGPGGQLQFGPSAAAASAGFTQEASGSITVEPKDPAEPPVPREPVLQRALSVNTSVFRVTWTVDARKLKSTDREAVSPPFELSFTREVQFKMVIRPKAVNEQRGGASFKKAKGKGSVWLRCLDEVDRDMNPVVTFRIAVGARQQHREEPRGPVRHDFSDRAICGLPE